jgi:cytochrome P450
MTDFETLDWFRDMRFADDPYPYFEYLRGKGPVQRLPHHQVVAVTGYAEALQVYKDAETFSSINATAGPMTPLGFTPAGDDITEQLERHRAQIPMSDRLVSMDAPDHAPLRSILSRLFTPSRLRANEKYLELYADRLIDRFAGSGRVEMITDYGRPFSGMVIADLLGVPDEDRPWFEDQFSGRLPTIEEGKLHHDIFHALEPKFVEYIVDRRANPRNDVLTDVATAKLPDGSMPAVEEVSLLAASLFVAGQDTTARLLGTALQVIAERPDIQERLRADSNLIPDFVEEALRFDGPVKTSNRLVRKTTCLAGVELPAGTTVSLFNGAINRDPSRFEMPGEFRLGRPKAQEHCAFGRGAHVCVGAPLARKETVVSVQRLLERLGEIRVSGEKHGPPNARRFHHEPHYILRGLRALHLTFTPLKGAATGR